MGVPASIIMLVKPYVIGHYSQICKFVHNWKVLKLFVLFEMGVVGIKLVVEVFVVFGQFEAIVDPLVIRIL